MFFVFLIVLFFTQKLKAQTPIQSIISDVVTNKPLEGVKIQLQNSQTFYTSSSKGYFYLNIDLKTDKNGGVTVEEAMKQAHQAVQAMGGTGFMNESTVSRLFRDAKLMEIGAGTSEIRRMLIGRELMANQ